MILFFPGQLLQNTDVGLLVEILTQLIEFKPKDNRIFSYYLKGSL